MEGNQFRVRVRGVLLLFAVILVGFSWVLYDLQVNQYDAFYAQSQRKIARTETVSAARGAILDRYGRVLVDNLPSYNVSLDISFMGERKTEILLTLLDVSRGQEVPWVDTLPISSEAPFVFTFSDASNSAVSNYRKYLDKLDKAIFFRLSASIVETGVWSDYKVDANELMTFLRELYGIDAGLGDKDARALVGILYELALRSKEVSQVAYVFAQNVDIDFITAVKERKLDGVNFDATTVRQYHTEYAAHILGRVGLMNSDEWQIYGPLDYPYNANVGKDGVEKAFEQYLHGTSGTKAIETNKSGKVVSEQWMTDPETGEVFIPSPGGNTLLTLDVKLQGAVERSLADRIPTLPSKEAEGASVVVMNVTDGSVLAMASYPTFDLSQYGTLFSTLRDDPLNPLYNRATMGLYPPGSVYKMVTAVGGLQEGLITPQTRIRDTGRYTYYKDAQPQCWIYRQYGGTHGNMTVSDAIRDSCNIFFYDTGRRLGIDLLDQYSRMFGLGEKTGIEVPERRGVVAGPKYTVGVLEQEWYEGSTMYAAIGQENNQFTPLQLANYIATLVNGGTHYQAHLLKSVKSNDYTQVLHEQEPVVLDTIDIDATNLEAVKNGMLQVSQSSKYFKQLPFDVGAKTGSAQVSSSSQSNAVYVCFAPYDNPQIAISIVVEKGGSGGELGAIAEDILEFYFSSDSTLEHALDENTLIR